MKPQGLENYRAGSKKNWRGWQWNRIVERLSVPVEDALVLYLCGPEDLDREKALERGFRNENLIAVDGVKENIEKVRKQGGLGISHDLHDVLKAWPFDWPVHIVSADFCGGLDEGLVFAHTLFFSPTLHRLLDCPVVAVNLQRGRDTQRKGVGKVVQEILESHGKFDNNRTKQINPAKHRGLMLAMAVQRGILRGFGIADEAELPIEVFEMQTAAMDWVVTSYKSGRVYMDSLVFRWTPPPWCLNLIHADLPTEPAARRKIAACRAVRTAKLRKKGKGR